MISNAEVGYSFYWKKLRATLKFCNENAFVTNFLTVDTTVRLHDLFNY